MSARLSVSAARIGDDAQRPNGSLEPTGRPPYRVHGCALAAPRLSSSVRLNLALRVRRMGEHKTRRPRQSAYFLNFGRELRTGMFYGLSMASLYCLYVIGLYLLVGSEPFEKVGVSLMGAVASYIGGGLACGVLYATLHPLGKSFIGAMLLGIPCGIAVIFGAVVAMEGLPTQWTRDTWEMVLVLGVLFGVICGPIARSQMRIH